MAIFTNNFSEFKREAHELIDEAEADDNASKVESGIAALLSIHNVRIDRDKFSRMVSMLCLANNPARARKLVNVLDDVSLKSWALYSIRGVFITLLGSAALAAAVGVVYFALWLFK